MVLALPEKFFEKWEWKRGDIALYSDGSHNFKPDSLSLICLGDKNHKSFLFENGKLGYYKRGDFYEVDRIIKPIPSQKQLQKICMDIIQCSPQDLLKFFEAWLYEDEIRPVVDFEDFDDLWLRYTVWVWSRLEWNGEKWKEA